MVCRESPLGISIGILGIQNRHGRDPRNQVKPESRTIWRALGKIQKESVKIPKHANGPGDFKKEMLEPLGPETDSKE